MSGRKLCQKVIMKDDRPLKFHSRGFMLQEEKKGNKKKGKKLRHKLQNALQSPMEGLAKTSSF